MQPNLDKMFEEINAKHFNNEIDKTFPVSWSSSLRTTAGLCRWKRRFVDGFTYYEVTSIEMNERLFSKNNWEGVREILIHEMVHAWLIVKFHIRGHGPEFQSKMREILGNRKSYTYHNFDVSDLREKKNVKVICQSCGLLGFRMRLPPKRLKGAYRCKKCGGRVRHEREAEHSRKTNTPRKRVRLFLFKKQ